MVGSAALAQGAETAVEQWAYFTKSCRANLHVVLCFSPIGGAFRERLRQNPSLVNCCTIDWFQASLSLMPRGLNHLCIPWTDHLKAIAPSARGMPKRSDLNCIMQFLCTAAWLAKSYCESWPWIHFYLSMSQRRTSIQKAGCQQFSVMQEWPQDALEAVARKFLLDMPLQKQVQTKLVSLCHAIHCKVITLTLPEKHHGHCS